MDSFVKSSSTIAGTKFSLKKQLIKEPEVEAVSDAEDESTNEVDHKLKRASSILEDGQDPFEPKRLAVEFGVVLTPDERSKIEALKAVPFNKEKEASFFKQNCTYAIGNLSTIYARLGIEEYQKVWKVFLKRENKEGNPSLLDFFFSETRDVLEMMNHILVTIQGSFGSGIPAYKPISISPGYKSPYPEDGDFWEHLDVLITESGSFRIRPVWQPGNYYYIYMNSPREYNTDKDPSLVNKTGPKMKLVIPDLRQLMVVLEDMLNDTPSMEKLMALTF